MGVETLVLDRRDRADQVGGQIVEAHELALLAVGAVVGADQLGLEEERPDLAIRLEIADGLDLAAGEAQPDQALGLGAARVLEGAPVDAHLARRPVVAPEGEVAAVALAVAEAREAPFQVDQLPVEARVDDGGRGEHPGRDAEELALEALPHDPVELDQVATGAEADPQADPEAQQGERAESPEQASLPRRQALLPRPF